MVKLELQKEIEKLKDLLTVPCKITVISHYNPDGDAIGSLMALYHYLKMKGHEVWAMTPNDFPGFLSWMNASDKIVVAFKHLNKAVKIISESDIIICVDFNDADRLKNIGKELQLSKAVKALIDHHPEQGGLFSIKIVDIHASATSELIYKYIVEAGDRKLIDKNIAECIFAGIMTDTGCFSFNSSKPETYKIIADLLTTGINKDKIYNLVYDNFSFQRMKLLGYCLNEKMVLLPGLHAAYISLTKDELDKYNFVPGDSEGFVNLPFSISGIHIAALFTEKKDHVRISMRSRGGFAVNEFCEKYFEGGGHKNAAGGESKLSMKETIEKFEKHLELYRNEINNVNWFDL